MIVFGHNNFNIKTFTPRDLRMPHEAGAEKIEFQVRQRYFHLFWIPFFPIGKLYVMKRAGDTNKYVMPEDIKRRIKTQHNVRTPWYSFALFFVAAFAGLAFAGNDRLKDVKWENRFYEDQAAHRMMIKYPTTGDYYEFGANECETTDSYNGTNVILKVTEYDDDTITFASGYLDMLGKNQYAYSIRAEIAKNNTYSYNSFTVKKENLLKLLDTEYQTSTADKPHMEDLGWCFKFRGMERAKLEL